MSTKTPTLALEPSTLTAGPIRRNHLLELFSDSDREANIRRGAVAERERKNWRELCNAAPGAKESG
jgi:hypothetical protein